MNRWIFCVPLLFAFFFIISCDNQVDAGYYGAYRVSFLSMNTNMEQSKEIPLYATRTKALVKKITDEKSDVICLQEVWDAKEMQNIKNALNDREEKYYTLYSTEEAGELPPPEPACTQEEVMPIAMCYSQKCGNQTGTGALLCLVQQCGTELQNLSPQCSQCLISEGSSGSFNLQDMMKVCMEVPDVPSEDQNKTNGLMLISRFPMKDKKIESLPSATIPRSYLAATLVTQGTFGDITVVCTQLSNSEDGNQADTLRGAQADAIMTYVNALPLATIQVLLGDFDSSPETQTMPAHNPQILQTFKQNAFEDPWDENPFCSICRTNKQIQQQNEQWKIMPEYTPDHILFRMMEFPASFSVRRGDSPIVFDRKHTTTLSDHAEIHTVMNPEVFQ